MENRSIQSMMTSMKPTLSFCKQHCEDMRTSEGLKQYYLHRLERETEAKQWSQARTRKRKRCDGTNE